MSDGFFYAGQRVWYHRHYLSGDTEPIDALVVVDTGFSTVKITYPLGVFATANLTVPRESLRPIEDDLESEG